MDANGLKTILPIAGFVYPNDYGVQGRAKTKEDSLFTLPSAWNSSEREIPPEGTPISFVWGTDETKGRPCAYSCEIWNQGYYTPPRRMPARYGEAVAYDP